MADTRYITEYATLSRHALEQRAASRRRWKRVLAAAGPVAAVVAGAAWVALPLAMMAGVIGAGVLFFLGIPETTTVPPDAMTGAEGERAVLDRLAELPDDFLVFNQVRIPDPWLPGGRRELDFVVVGPASVSVVEVKNVPGAVYVQPGAKHWPAARRGCCGGTPSWGAMDNPLPQVGAQARALDHLLLQQGIGTEVHSVLCFPRPGVMLENTDAAPIPVVTGEMLVKVLREIDAAADASVAMRRNVVELLTVRTGRRQRHAA